MEFLDSLSDDRTALLGCFVAIALCGVLMSLSGILGRSVRDHDTAGDALPLPNPTSDDNSVPDEHQLPRKAA